MYFLKLGGSLITDKTQDNTPRLDVIARLAREVASAPHPLLIGHGSGSFGHAAAQKYGTRNGVSSAEGWRGFAEVSVVAARLNRLVADALHEAGVPVMSFAPSASARCENGAILALDVQPIKNALARGIVPLVMGDVAFDTQRGGTIVSTEEVFAFLVGELHPERILLAGETDGVYERYDPRAAENRILEKITPHNWNEIQSGLGGSRGADVTGGMASKVRDMLALTQAHAPLTAHIFSGLHASNVQHALQGDIIGTTIAAQ